MSTESSSQDKAITAKAIEAGRVLDIEVCDYLIVNDEGDYI